MTFKYDLPTCLLESWAMLRVSNYYLVLALTYFILLLLYDFTTELDIQQYSMFVYCQHMHMHTFTYDLIPHLCLFIPHGITIKY